VARHLSGSVTSRERGVVHPGRGALFGALTGVVLFALPAAGAAWLATWVMASVAFGLAGLVGAVPAAQVGELVVATALGSSALAALMFGLVGAVVGCLIGLVVGLIDSRARGLSGTEVSQTMVGLGPGAWATVARVRSDAAPLVREELARLGGTPAPEPGV